MNFQKALRLALVVGLALFITAGAGACNGIPDQNSGVAGFNFTINIKGTPKDASGVAAKSAPQLRIEKLDPRQPQGEGLNGVVIPGPNLDAWVLRVELSNPTETFLVFGFVPGVPVRLLVTPGENRVLDVQAYLISAAASISPEIFPATHYYTAYPPEAQRTLNLTQSGQSVSIELAPSPTAAITGGSVNYDEAAAAMNMASGPMNGFTDTIPLPLAGCGNPTYGCPDYQLYYTNFSDPTFGVNFPSINTYLYSGGLMTSNVPMGRPLNLKTFHYSSGIYANNSVNLTANATINLNFTGWYYPTVKFSPASLRLHPLDSGMVHIGLYGGWGTYSVSLGPYDTCMGSPFQSGPYWYYSFMAPSSSCVINVIVYDCGCSTWGPFFAEGTMHVTVSGSGWSWTGPATR